MPDPYRDMQRAATRARTISDEGRNNRARLAVRGLMRREARLARLLPISDARLRRWMAAAAWLDGMHLEQVEEACASLAHTFDSRASNSRGYRG